MRTFLVLFQKEFIQIWRNPFMPRLIVLFPIVIMLVMPMVMTMDVRNVNVAIVDRDGSSLSRRIASDIAASEYFTLESDTPDFGAAMCSLEKGRADVIVQIPEGFERRLVSGDPEPVAVTANAVNATKGQIGMQYLLQSISGTVSHVRAEKVPVNVTQVQVSVQNRFNPTLDYERYMIPALMIILFVLICGFLPALSFVREKEVGTIEQINVTPVGKLTFVLSKLIPYWLIGLFVLTIAIIVAILVYGVAPVGSLWLVYLGAMLFILAISGFSLTIANFSSTMQQAVFVMFFFILIFMLMSGLLTPIDSMPEWAQRFTIVLPPRYYVEILRSVYLKGAAAVELWADFAALGIFALIFNTLAAITYRKQQ